MKTQSHTKPMFMRWRAHRRGWSMAARCVTALLGGYAAAAGLASLMARLLPIARVDATAWGMIASFLIYALLALWAFHEQRMVRVALMIWGSAVVSIMLVWMMGPRV